MNEDGEDERLRKKKKKKTGEKSLYIAILR